MIEFLIAVVLFILAAFLTYRLKGLLIKYAILDTPNHRSSHQVPTPRGGGMVIVLFLLITSVILFILQRMSFTEFCAVSIPLFLTSGVALIDDKISLSIAIRAIVYWVSACAFLFFIDFEAHFLCFIILSILIVWVMNLYNFMDGIDGLAAIEALSTAVFSLFIFHDANAVELFYLTLVLISSTAGFLVFNWPPARLFMGDVGSCSLGLWFSIMSLWGYVKYDLSPLIWWVLLSVFIADATYTLIRRFISGEKWYEPHKQHAYQKLVGLGFSHRNVTLLVLLVNILVTWPLAYLLYFSPDYSIIIVLFNYAILLIFWLKIQFISIKDFKVRS